MVVPLNRPITVLACKRWVYHPLPPANVTGCSASYKEEQFILQDRSTNRAAVLILVNLWDLGLEVIVCIQEAVPVELKCTSVEAVRPRFRGRIQDCTRIAPKLWIDRIRNHLNFRNGIRIRLHQWTVQRQVIRVVAVNEVTVLLGLTAIRGVIG